MLYKKIMVAVDGSEVSQQALQHAMKLAENQKAKLVLLHIVEETFGFRGGVGFDYDYLISRYRDEGLEILKQAAGLVKANSALKCKTLLVELNPFQGRIAEVIIDKVKELSIDLIILGTHGRRGFNHWLLGSVAEDLMRIAITPVLLTHVTHGQF
ncbi:universal stress protein [Legionella sp. km772]|uniref:universal stress protein n=1 Tax=Legionella sp. km772 TaxID=2498111 RepID=UPI000F8C8F4A|nr:universal stress protein [Legionella sp. km772]RUR05882.1 universal stress protein [Legionella sp. km772]